MFETNDVVSQRLGQVALSFNRVDRGFIFGPQHFPEETDRRLFFELARRIEAAAVVEKHRESNTRFRTRQIAEWPQFTVHAKFEVVQLQIHNCIAALIDYRNRNRNKVRSDPNDVVRIDLVAGFL